MDWNISRKANNNINDNSFSKGVITYRDICDYAMSCRALLDEALFDGKKLVFVTGYNYPDIDAVVSSILEAYRLSMKNKDEDVVILPLIRADIMPAEIAKLLGEDIYPELVYASDTDIEELLSAGRVSFIYCVPKYRGNYKKGTTDTAFKYFDGGYSFDKKLSRLLYGAMLMDTENRVSRKTTSSDGSLMDWLKQKAAVTDDEDYYSELMSELITETDISTLYYRDYQEYKGVGFSTIKVCDFVGKESFSKKIKHFKEIAKTNNSENNLSLTLINLVEYEKNGLKILRDRLYYVWGDGCNDSVRSDLPELLKTTITAEFPKAEIEICEGFVEVTNLPEALFSDDIFPVLESFFEV